MKKIISLLMIAIMIFVSFTVYYPEEVSAAAVNTCSITKGTNPDFCIEGESVVSSNCLEGHFYQGKRVS